MSARTRAVDLDVEHDLARAHDLNRARAVVREVDRDLDRALARALDVSLERALTGARDPTNDLGRGLPDDLDVALAGVQDFCLGRDRASMRVRDLVRVLDQLSVRVA